MARKKKKVEEVVEEVAVEETVVEEAKEEPVKETKAKKPTKKEEDEAYTRLVRYYRANRGLSKSKAEARAKAQLSQ